MLLTALSTRLDTDPPDFPCTGLTQRSVIGADGCVDASLLTELEQTQAGILEQAGGLMTFQLWDLLEHVRHTRWIHRFEVTRPEFFLQVWARRNNTILITADGVPQDAKGVPLVIAAEGEAAGVVPVLPEATERARRIRSRLRARGVDVPAHLPPVRAEAEVLVRAGDDIARRTLALGLTAVFAQSLLMGDPEDTEQMRRRFPTAFAARTAVERRLFDDRSEAAAAPLAWRVEAAKTLLWALGRLPALGPAVTSPNVDGLYSALFAGDEAAFLGGCRLRPVDDLLDELEFTHSLRHAALRAQRHGRVVPAANVDVLAERGMALGWALEGTYQDYEQAGREI